MVRARDLHRQVISKIVAAHTGELVVYTNREHPQIQIARPEFDWHAENIVRTEARWIRTAPTPIHTVWREEIADLPVQVCERISISPRWDQPTRFRPNPRSIQSLCRNWNDTLDWPLPHRPRIQHD